MQNIMLKIKRDLTIRFPVAAFAVVENGPDAFDYIYNQPSAIICFCSSIILIALHQMQKEIMQKIETKITK